MYIQKKQWPLMKPRSNFMWLLLVVLLVPVGVKAGALRQTRGEDADRTEVKAKSTTIMHHFQTYGSALYNRRALFCGPTCRGCADGFICGGGGVANTTEGGCPGGNEGCNKKEVMSSSESEGRVHVVIYGGKGLFFLNPFSNVSVTLAWQ